MPPPPPAKLVDWPPAWREALAVCAALRAVRDAAGAGGGAHSARRALGADGAEASLRASLGAHLRQLVEGACADEARGTAAAERSAWQRVGGTVVLSSCAVVWSSLCLHASRLLALTTPALADAFASELRAVARAYAAHLLAVARRAAPRALAPAAAAALAAASASGGGAADEDDAAAAGGAPLDGAVLFVCVASAHAMLDAVAQLHRHRSLRAAGGTPLVRDAAAADEWSGEAAADLTAAAEELRAAAAAVEGRLCEAAAALCAGCALERFCDGGGFWAAPKPWLDDSRCSRGVQLLPAMLGATAADLRAVGAVAVQRRLLLRTLRLCGDAALRLAWTVAPSRARAPQLARDVRLLVALLAAGAATAEQEATAEAEAARLRQLSLGGLALLALRRAPLSALCDLAERSPPADRSAAEPDWDATLAAARGSAAADAALRALAVDGLAPATAGKGEFDPLRSHAALADAARLPAADADWAGTPRRRRLPAPRRAGRRVRRPPPPRCDEEERRVAARGGRRRRARRRAGRAARGGARGVAARASRLNSHGAGHI